MSQGNLPSPAGFCPRKGSKASSTRETTRNSFVDLSSLRAQKPKAGRSRESSLLASIKKCFSSGIRLRSFVKKKIIVRFSMRGRAFPAHGAGSPAGGRVESSEKRKILHSAKTGKRM